MEGLKIGFDHSYLCDRVNAFQAKLDAYKKT